mgnify:CR=1 FL=1
MKYGYLIGGESKYFTLITQKMVGMVNIRAGFHKMVLMLGELFTIAGISLNKEQE